MSVKEATARIKINKLLEVAGWRFFVEGKLPANIQLEPSITIKMQDLDALGEDFEKSSKGFIDFLLLNEKGFPFIVLEAKAEDKSPLAGKEQARKYAKSQSCRFVILSNGNLHYFWDIERGNDYKAVIYKDNRDDWRHAEIVVTTVQSLLFNNKYQQLFSPTDFDLVISDEAHRSIGGNARAVFDYFIGYKLGLTATPRDYLKKFDKTKPNTKDPRELERRLLLDTYRTFGCEDGQPTYRYSLLDGVKEGFLINPTVVDARSEVTTQLLSEDGFVVDFKDDQGEDQKETFKQSEFEKRFFSDATNQLFCKTFLEHAHRDPISGEIGKSIIFAVSQHHAAKLAQILNLMADVMFPGKYQSDFAVQVTSQITDAQQFTINFTHNKLLGSGNFLPAYKTSKARICVTVGMMTTGYDCPDLLNLGLFRPIFSPTDFIQIKGRGTRKHNFLEELTGTGGLQRVPRDYVENFQIPLPPLEVQQEIVAEIEGYQKVIDGARAVLDNYRPQIPIHPDWPIIPLAEIIKLSSGEFLSAEMREDGASPVYGGNGINGHHSAYLFELPTVVIGRVGAYCGAVHLTEPKSWVTDNALYVRELLKPTDLAFLAISLRAINLNQYAKVGGQPSISQSIVLERSIPFPDIETQQAIVAEIEAEQALVAANRELIARFEQKIQAALARVWGEDESATVEA